MNTSRIGGRTAGRGVVVDERGGASVRPDAGIAIDASVASTAPDAAGTPADAVFPADLGTEVAATPADEPADEPLETLSGAHAARIAAPATTTGRRPRHLVPPRTGAP